MSDLLKRLYNIARTFGPKKDADLGDWPNQEAEEDFASSQYHHQGTRQAFSNVKGDTTPGPDMPDQLIEDLANFDLKPPSSLEAVRRARNLAFKKYHPDMHMGDREKIETAKRIMQIYNASYERLKAFYTQ